MIRCKFSCSAITQTSTDTPTHKSRQVTFHAIAEANSTVPEDQKFTKYTPSGKLEVTIDNPAALESLKVGAFYYLDLTPVGSP